MPEINETAIEGAITLDFKGNPKIKITKDKPEVTFDLYSDDINFIKSCIDKTWALVPMKKPRQ